MQSRIRILLIDDHALFRESLIRALGEEPDLEVVGACGSVEEGVMALARGGADLVLLDVDLGRERGGEFLERAAEFGVKPRVLAVTGGISDTEGVQLICQGAQGIFFKHGTTEELIRAIHQVMEGHYSVDARFHGQERAAEDARPVFTERERTVFLGIYRGLSNKQLSDDLRTSEAVVKATLQRLFQKTGVRTRGQLVRIVLEKYRHLITGGL